jgi:hypothetical protein
MNTTKEPSRASPEAESSGVPSGTFAAHARGEETCYATIRDNAKYGNELIAFHDSPPPQQPGVSGVRAWVKYADNGLIRIWRILPNNAMSHERSELAP